MAEKLTSPVDVVVGKEYNVPCVAYNFRILPILPPYHEDGPEFCLKAAPPHYHVDARFIQEDHDGGVYLRAACSEPFIEKMHCFYNKTVAINPYIFNIEKMHRVFQDHVLKNRICPHKGVKIVNRCGTCPGHHLIWNLKTKRLKYRLPFFICMPEDSGKGEIINSAARIEVKKNYRNSNGIVLFLCDANGEVYPDAKYRIRTVQKVSAGDVLRLNDANCSKE